MSSDATIENLAMIENLRADLAAALPRWDLPADSSIVLLSHSENTTFLAKDPNSGRELVLRVHRVGYHTPPEIRSELAWIAALIESNAVETPRPVADREGVLLCAVPLAGSSRGVVAFERMSGREPDQSDPLPAWFRKLGAVNAQLHLHSRKWSRRADYTRKAWDFDAMLGSRPLWGDWRDAIGLGTAEQVLLQRVADTLSKRLAAYGTGPERFGLVHADLRLANLLVDGDRLGVIDFDDCGFSWFFYDFAAAVSFFEHDPIVEELQAAWVEGYRTLAPVSAEDEAMLPSFVMLRRMLLTAWIASHSETVTAQQLGARYTEGTVAMGERFLRHAI
jgi:Ser/Thr protein kinase RdoA (MazF antagonist)